MQIFVRPIVLPGEVFAILRGVGHPPVFCKNLFLQMGDPKGVHQGYHEMTYTKFGRGRSFGVTSNMRPYKSRPVELAPR